jgi:hypothetical protein
VIGRFPHESQVLQLPATSTRFAPTLSMTAPTHSIRSLGGKIGRSLTRLALVVIGFVLMVIGLGMTVTVVMLPAGVVLGLLGVATFLTGIFAPDLLGKGTDL